VRCRLHGFQSRFHRRLESSPQFRSKAILVHSDLLSYGFVLTVAIAISAFAKKDGQTRPHRQHRSACRLPDFQTRPSRSPRRPPAQAMYATARRSRPEGFKGGQSMNVLIADKFEDVGIQQLK